MKQIFALILMTVFTITAFGQTSSYSGNKFESKKQKRHLLNQHGSYQTQSSHTSHSGFSNSDQSSSFGKNNSTKSFGEIDNSTGRTGEIKHSTSHTLSHLTDHDLSHTNSFSGASHSEEHGKYGNYK